MVDIERSAGPSPGLPSALPAAGMLAPFRIHDFRLAWYGIAAGRAGIALVTLCVAWLVADSSGSALAVALVQTASSGPLCLLIAPSALLGDAVSKRRILICGHAGMAVAASALLAGVLLHSTRPPLLLGLFVLFNSAYAFTFASGQAALFLAAGQRHGMAAASLNLFSFNLARVGSSLVGVYLLGANDALVLTLAILFVTVLPACLALRPAALQRHETARQSLFSAPAVVLRHPGFRRSLAGLVCCSFPASVVLALLPMVVVQNNLGGASAFGVLMALFGIGALLGTPAMSFATSAPARLPRTLQLSSFGMGMSLVAMAVSPGIVVGLPVLCAGFFWSLISAILSGTSRRLLPDDVQSSAAGVYTTASYAGLALGSVCWGVVADHLGLTSALSAAGVVMVLNAAVLRSLVLRAA